MIKVQMFPSQNSLSFVTDDNHANGVVSLNTASWGVDGKYHIGYDRDDILVQLNDESDCIEPFLSFNDFKILQDNWNQMQEIRKEKGLTS